MQIGAHGPGGAHADDIFHAIEIEKLIGIDADGGHAHAGGHDGDPFAVIGAGIALHAPDIIDQPGVGQEIFRNEFGSQRVAGHQHRGGEIADLRVNMRSGRIGHEKFLL